jgi:Glycosyltransferase like family
MPPTTKITFVSAVNDRQVFESNFLISPILASPHPHQVIVQSGFPSAAAAYNDAIDRSENEIIVFCHQDMMFPSSWLVELERSLLYLDRNDRHWGVLGCFGKAADGGDRGHIYMPGLGEIGAAFDHPERVRTLDEIVLIVRKSSGLRYDDTLPYYHFYGADICLQAARRGFNCYAIPAFCIHNTQFNLVLPKEFYDCYRHIKKCYRSELPIVTTCVEVSTYDVDMYLRRLREFYLRRVKRITIGNIRWQSGQRLLDEIESQNRHRVELAKRGEKQLCS